MVKGEDNENHKKYQIKKTSMNLLFDVGDAPILFDAVKLDEELLAARMRQHGALREPRRVIVALSA